MNRAKSWCWFLCFLGSISSLLISETLAQSDDDPYWDEDGDLPDWVEDGDLPDFGELMPADVGQGLTFRIIARVSAPRSSLDSPVSGDFSIRIMPSDTAGLEPIKCQPWFGIEYNEGDTCWVGSPDQAGFVRVPCADDAAPFYECWESGEKVQMMDLGFCPSRPVFGPDDRCLIPNETDESVEITGRAKDNKWLTRPTDEMLITRPPASLLGHELSVSTGAGYIPRRGKSEHAASGMTYSWASLVNWSELISWTGTMDNEQVSYPNPPLGVNKELSFARQSSVGPAEALAELKVIIRPSKYDFRANGSVSLLSVNNGAPDRFAEAEADLAITVTAHEPVWVSVTNCGLFDPDDFYTQSVIDLSYSGGDCRFRFGQFIEPTESDEGPDSEDFECTIAVQGKDFNIIAYELSHTLQDVPGVTLFDQTEKAREALEREIALCRGGGFDQAFCKKKTDSAAELLANPVETDLIMIAGDHFSAEEGIQSLTVISRDGRSEVFELNFDEMDDPMEALKYAPEDVVAEIIERFVEGC